MTAAAVAAGAAVALGMAVGSAGAAPAPVTIGSTSGTPAANIPNCAGGTNCTYFSTSSGTTPAAQVPSDGTITSFSVNAGSAGGTVSLRVLRPTGSSFTGAGTSPAETLALGVNTFTVSLPVKAGDVLGIDNASQALIFDNTALAATTHYWIPALSDGAASAPTAALAGDKLLLSAVEQPNDTTTTTTNPTTPTTPSGPITSTNPSSVPTPTSNTKPSLSSVSQSNRAWRRGGKLATIAATPSKKGPPTGTRFQLTLNEPAKVTLAFKHKVKVRTKTGKTSFVMKTVGQLTFVGHSGVNTVFFQGRLTRSQTLGTGNWTGVFGASTSAGSAQSVSRQFTILR